MSHPGRTIRDDADRAEAGPYGPQAARALRAAVVTAKAGDPLAPVTVVVPTNYVGVAARRLLGSGALGRVTEGGDGVAGVTFLTAFRLAELLGAPKLAAAHRRPVSIPVLAAGGARGARRRSRSVPPGGRAPGDRGGAGRRAP